jgi:hypothetical protein
LHHTSNPQRLKNAIGQLISVIEGKETIQQMNRIGLAYFIDKRINKKDNDMIFAKIK